MAEPKKKKTATKVKTKVVESTKSNKNKKTKSISKTKVVAEVKPKPVKKSADKAKSTQKPKKKKEGYFAGAWKELKKVRWTDRKTTWQMTGAVLLFTIFILLIVTGLDMLFNYLFKLVIS